MRARDRGQRVATGWTRASGRQNAQALVEFGLVLPMFLAVMMVAVQIALLLFAQLALAWVTHDMVRFVASGNPENWRFPDSCQVNRLPQFLPPILVPTNITSVAFSPPYQPSQASCTNVTQNVPAADAIPANPMPRLRGGGLTLTLSYQPSNLVFLPANFLGVPVLPHTITYRAAAVLE